MNRWSRFATSAVERLQGLRRQFGLLVCPEPGQAPSGAERETANEFHDNVAEAVAQPTEASLAEKRRQAEMVVETYAGLAAANAFNLVPGLDVGIDVGIVAAMAQSLVATFGLRREQIDALQWQAAIRTSEYQALQQIAERFTPYLAGKLVSTALAGLGLECLARETSKWLPLVGTVLSASIGYRMVHRLGEQLLNDCEVAAREVLSILAGAQHTAPLPGDGAASALAGLITRSG
jgi:hypothetical protein